MTSFIRTLLISSFLIAPSLLGRTAHAQLAPTFGGSTAPPVVTTQAPVDQGVPPPTIGTNPPQDEVPPPLQSGTTLSEPSLAPTIGSPSVPPPLASGTSLPAPSADLRPTLSTSSSVVQSGSTLPDSQPNLASPTPVPSVQPPLQSGTTLQSPDMRPTIGTQGTQPDTLPPPRSNAQPTLPSGQTVTPSPVQTAPRSGTLGSGSSVNAQPATVTPTRVTPATQMRPIVATQTPATSTSPQAACDSRLTETEERTIRDYMVATNTAFPTATTICRWKTSGQMGPQMAGMMNETNRVKFERRPFWQVSIAERHRIAKARVASSNDVQAKLLDVRTTIAGIILRAGGRPNTAALLEITANMEQVLDLYLAEKSAPSLINKLQIYNLISSSFIDQYAVQIQRKFGVRVQIPPSAVANYALTVSAVYFDNFFTPY